MSNFRKELYGRGYAKKGTVFKKPGKTSQQCQVAVRSLLGQEYAVFDK